MGRSAEGCSPGVETSGSSLETRAFLRLVRDTIGFPAVPGGTKSRDQLHQALPTVVSPKVSGSRAIPWTGTKETEEIGHASTTGGNDATGGTRWGSWCAYDVSSTGISGERRPTPTAYGRFSPVSTVPPPVEMAAALVDDERRERGGKQLAWRATRGRGLPLLLSLFMTDDIASPRRFRRAHTPRNPKGARPLRCCSLSPS